MRYKMRAIIFTILLASLSNLSFAFLSGISTKLAKLNPFTKYNHEPTSVEELVTRHGYPYEEYDVETDDGFILTMHRIPHGRNNNTWGGSRPALLLQHGIMCSSACWVLSEPEQGLGFILADAGYDVWMGNNRGTTYGRKHKRLDPIKNSDKYYDFSFHELGVLDLPAMIDYIINFTNQPKIHYVGHSQGTTQYFVMASVKPEYNDKIKVMNALAPIAILKRTRGLVKASAFAQPLIMAFFDLKGNGDLLCPNKISSYVQKAMCGSNSVTRPLCDNLLFMVGGYNALQLNTSLLPEIVQQCPTGASIKQLRHFSQLTTNGGKFVMFDYGNIQNRIKYRSRNPPEYPIEQITTHLIFHYSNNDYISSAEDVETFAARVQSSELVKVPMETFTHLDYMWATDAKKILYDPMIELMKKYD